MALINCPECNKEISDKAASCPNCGCPINSPATSSKEEYLCCPKCLSRELHAEQKGFSGGKAFTGAILAGGIGILAGTIGSKDVQITCLKCGNKFKPGEAYYPSRYTNSTKREALEFPEGVTVHKREYMTQYSYKCPLCNKTYNSDLNHCPKCGRKFLEADKISNANKGGCASIILFFIVFSSLIYTLSI